MVTGEKLLDAGPALPLSKMGAMCGIAGLAGPAADREALVRAMSTALAHRGPDESGQSVDQHIALAIRRLSIIDVAGGHQPYVNEQGTVHVVFDGEIDGFAELRERLDRGGLELRHQEFVDRSSIGTGSTIASS